MERLTFVDEDGVVLFDNPSGFQEDIGFTICELAENEEWVALDNIAQSLANCEQRLKHYEDLEEQGLLLKLPCKVGNTVYKIFMNCPNNFKPEYCKDHEGSCEKCNHRVPIIISGTFSFQNIKDFGKTVFLTQAEAEEALKRLEVAE